MTERSIDFVEHLASRFPGLAPVLDEHREANFGEILPHVFFYDVTLYALALLAQGEVASESTSARELRELLDHLEQTYAFGDPELTELISVSFLENLPLEREKGSQIRKMLGKTLSEQLRVIG